MSPSSCVRNTTNSRAPVNRQHTDLQGNRGRPRDFSAEGSCEIVQQNAQYLSKLRMRGRLTSAHTKLMLPAIWHVGGFYTLPRNDSYNFHTATAIYGRNHMPGDYVIHTVTLCIVSSGLSRISVKQAGAELRRRGGRANTPPILFV